MLRLSTFGGCILARDGVRDEAFSAQRKTLGLLALLAAAGGRGVPRPLLLAYLWPESDEERARTSLKQLVHAVRTRLGADVLLGSAELRLNPDRISADVTEFRAAIEQDDHARAVALYAGPFLEGFFLREADDFERWSAEQREVLSRQFCHSLESIAEQAGAAGDVPTAVAAWRRLALAEPLSARAATGLIQALEASGERAEALRHARAYEQLVQAEVGGAPDPAVSALAARLRATRTVSSSSDQPATGKVTTGTDALDLPRVPPKTAGFRRRLLANSALVLVAGAGIGWAALYDPAAPLLSGRIVVAPFENLTGDGSLDHLSRIAADWLTQAITEIDSVDVVSPAAVAIVLRDYSGPAAEARMRLARATRARRVVTGGFAKRGADSVVLHASVVDAGNGKLVWTLDPATAPLGDPTIAIQALREQLLGAILSDAIPRARVRGVRPPLYSAYREYLVAAERFERHSDMEGARPHLERAVALDSTFAAAWLMLVGTFVNRAQHTEAQEVLRRMERMRHVYSPTDLDMLELARAHTYLDYDGQLRATQQLAARDSNPVMLYLIGLSGNAILRPDLAVPALERSDSLMLVNGWRYQPAVLAEAYHQAGIRERELATVLRGRRLFPGEAQYPAQQLQALAGLGQAAAALALADTILRGISNSIGLRAWGVLLGSEEFRAHGDSVAAGQLAGMVADWYVSHPLATPPPARDLLEGCALYLTGQYSTAALRLERAARDTTLLDGAGYLALTYIKLGQRERAAAMADSLGGLKREWLFASHIRWRAAILGALGERERAVELLRQVIREHNQRNRWHSAPSLASLRGYEPFEELIRPSLPD